MGAGVGLEGERLMVAMGLRREVLDVSCGDSHALRMCLLIFTQGLPTRETSWI